GREPMRIAVWLAKWAAVVRLEPMMVKLLELDGRRSRLEMLVQAHVMPHRPWWLPATWLLRKEYPLTGTVRLHVSKGPKEDGSLDVVTLIDGSLHNIPKLPTALRTLVAVVMAYLPAATESYWSTFVGLLGDPSYRHRAEEHPTVVHKATTAVQAAGAAAAERTHQSVKSAIGGARARVESAAERVTGAADRMTESTAAGGAGGGVLGGAKHMAHEAAEALRGAVHDVAGAVKGSVEAGAEKVAEATDRALNAVKGHA
ncbi:hypothetical protein Vafri_19257, partial [Volvox africanus]